MPMYCRNEVRESSRQWLDWRPSPLSGPGLGPPVESPSSNVAKVFIRLPKNIWLPPIDITRGVVANVASVTADGRKRNKSQTVTVELPVGAPEFEVKPSA